MAGSGRRGPRPPRARRAPARSSASAPARRRPARPGAQPARRSAEGGAAQRPAGARAAQPADDPALDRRGARRDSISCSQTAQASASNGSGRRRGRSQGWRRITGPISGSRRKRRWKSRRSWSVPSAKRMRSTRASATSRAGPSALEAHRARRRPRRAPPRRRPRRAPRAPARRRGRAAPRRGPRPAAGRRRRAATSDFDARRLSVLEQVDVDEERARGGHLRAPAAAARRRPARSDCGRPRRGAAPSRAESRRRRAGTRRRGRGHRGGQRRPAARARSGAARASTGSGRTSASARARVREGLRAQAPGECTRAVERQVRARARKPGISCRFVRPGPPCPG